MSVNDSLSRVLRSHDLLAANTVQLNRDLHALAEALDAARATAPVLPDQSQVRVPLAPPRPAAQQWAPPVASQEPALSPVAAAFARRPQAQPQSQPRHPQAPEIAAANSMPGGSLQAANVQALSRPAPSQPLNPSLQPLNPSLTLSLTPPPPPKPAEPFGAALAKRLGISRTQLVSRVVAGVGGVITLVGVAFILVLAAQNGYFGPLARTIACGVLGAALVGVAFLIRHRDTENAGAHALLATGAAAGYLSLYAAGSLYEFVPSWVALTGTAVLGLGVVGIAVRWKSQWLASLGVASASLIGANLGGDPRVGVAFAVVLSVVTILAQLRTSWPIFLVARTVPALALLTIAAADAKPGTGIDTVLLSVIAGVFAVAGLLTAWIGRRSSTPEQTVIAVLVTLAPLPAMYGMWQLGEVWGTVTLGVLAATYLASAALPLFAAVSRSAVIPMGALLVTTAGLRLLGGDHFSTVLAAVAAAYACVALYSRSRVVASASAVLGSLATLAWIPGALTLVVLAQYSSPVGTSIFVTVWTLAAYLAWPKVLATPQPRWFRNLAILLGLVGASAAVDSLGVLLGRNLHDVHGGYVIASATVTVLWALASVVALWTPLRRGAGAGWVTLGLCLAGAATAKLFVIDLAVLTGIERGLAFLGVGLLLLVLGVGYAKAYERARTAVKPGTPPAPVGPAVPGPTS